MRITSIEAENFLSLKSFRWDETGNLSTGFNFLVGPNGTGKTNIFRAVEAVADIIHTERPTPWDRAVHKGQFAEPISIRLGVQFDTEWERHLLCAFLRTAFCDEASLRAMTSIPEMPTIDDLAFPHVSRIAMQNFLPADLPSLFEATIEVTGNGRGLWTATLRSRQRPDDLNWGIIIPRQSVWFHLHVGATFIVSSLFAVWWNGLVDDKREQASQFMRGFKVPCPKVDVQRLLDADVGMQLTIDTRMSLRLPVHAHLESLLRTSLPSNSIVDARWILDVIFRQNIVFTDNVRKLPSEKWPPVSLNEATKDIGSGQHLASLLYWLKNGEPTERQHYENIQRLFHSLVGRSFEVKHAVRTDHLNNISENLELVIVTGYGDVPLNLSGAGIAEALYLASIVADSAGKVLLLDEPAQNLHPNVQTRLLNIVADQEHTQVFLITHSPNLIPATALARISHVTQKDGQTDRATVLSPDWSDEERKSVERVLRRADARALLYCRGVVLVEGETEARAFPIWYEKFSGSSPESDDIVFYSVDGDYNFGPFLKLANQLLIPWAVICDGKAIGDLSSPCSIASQLKNAHVQGIPDNLPTALKSQGFEQRRETLCHYDVFSFATAATGGGEGFEGLNVVVDNRAEAARVLHAENKVLIGQYIAEQHECPDDVKQILKAVQQRMTG